MKVLVTGGGGFLGCHIIELLQHRGYDVRAMGRHKQPVLESRGVTFMAGDVSFLEDVERAVDGVDAVFHVAGRAKMDMDYQAYYNTHVVGTKNVVSSCEKYGVSRLVLTSSPAVVFNSRDFSGNDESLPLQKHYHWPYVTTKAQAEAHVLAHNSAQLKTVAIRPHLMLGEGDPHLIPNVLRRARRQQLKIVGDGENLVDITFVKNAAHAHLLAFDALERDVAGGKAYFIGQERPVKLWSLINMILESVGLEKVQEHISFRRAYWAGWAMEVFYKLFLRLKMPPMTRMLATVLSKNHYFSHERAYRDLGYTPLITIEQGLAELLRGLRLRRKLGLRK
ncbi:MAG: NAD-dependent epimerase/dehydratase family protein [Opitutales bacterium]|nr:NAD-dependent epimerase/dehydratase family protein [Opitutales bacterium]